jgi:hypothetical protein
MIPNQEPYSQDMPPTWFNVGGNIINLIRKICNQTKMLEQEFIAI